VLLAVLGIEPRLKRVSIESVSRNHNVTCYHYWKRVSYVLI
jgi:hypothetical protein